MKRKSMTSRCGSVRAASAASAGGAFDAVRYRLAMIGDLGVGR